MSALITLCRGGLVALLLCISTAATAQEFRAVRLGMTVSETGALKEQSQAFVSGVKFWARDLLDRGANPIELITYDDASSPERAAELYERLITHDKVDLLIGPYSSSLVMAVAPVVERHDFPMVVESSAPIVYEQGYKNIFGIYTTADVNMDGVLDMARENGLSSVAIAYQNSEFPAAVAEGARAAAPGKGLTIAFDESYPAGSSSLDQLAGSLSQTRPDLIVLGAYLEDSIAFVKALKATGYAPKMLAVSGAPSLRQFGEALGADADGVIATTQWMRSGRIPGAFDFAFRYREHYGAYPGYNAAGGYAAGQVIEAAARLSRLREVADDPQAIRSRIRENLASMKFESLLGRYRVDETGRQKDKPLYIIQWQGTHRSLIAPKDIARWQLKFPFPSWNAR